MRKQASEILADFVDQGVLDARTGPDTLITGIANVEKAGAEDLVFVGASEFVAQAINAKPACIVTTTTLASEFAPLSATAILTSRNVRLAQALLGQAYVDRDFRATEWSRVHPSAVIHESVTLPDDVVIGPNVVIGKDVQLGANVVVMANTVIEYGVKIGADTVIHPNVVISYECEIGERGMIKSGCTIGMEGFGFAQDGHRRSHRLPQLGKVIIGDDVVLGAQCNIDRAAYDETLIKDGCILDAKVHIAHGVELGEDAILCAHTTIAGSTRIGKRIICSGQTGILDHLSICDDVVLVQRAGVISDVKEPGQYAGHPAQPARQFFKNSAILSRLSDLKSIVNKLQKRLDKLDNAEDKS